MKVYFSCSITGGRDDQLIYSKIVEYLLSKNIEVPTAHLAQSNVQEFEGSVDEFKVFLRDVNWVITSDILIAEVSTPSHGVGYEIAIAEEHKKPIMCCYREGKKVSKMILGNNYPHLTLYEYTNENDLISAIDDFLGKIN